MKNKEKFYLALVDNKGKLNEIELGEKLGLDEQETSRIISALLAEHKIRFEEYRHANYVACKRINDNRKS